MSSDSTRREQVWFLDRCLGRKHVADALRAAGEQVELMDDHFAADTEDRIWVPEVGKRGWIILTKDASIRHNVLELVALLRSNTHSFVLTAMNQSGAAMAALFVRALPEMKKVIGKFQPPLIATITPAARVSVYLTHAQLIAKIDKLSGPK